MRVKTHFWFAVLTVIWSCTSAANDSVKFIDKHGFIVENQITTAQPVEQVWQALINDVDQWWPKDHSWWGEEGTFHIDTHAGGCFCETSGAKSAEHMHIVFVENFRIDFKHICIGLNVLHGNRCRFFHHFTKVSGNRKVAFSFRQYRLNK